MRRDQWWPAVQDLAEDQGGLFTAAQARLAGARRPQLAELLNAGMIERVQHGIYHLVGAPVDRWQAVRAAWLALDPDRSASERLLDPAGPGGVVSHRTAARMHDLGDIEANLIDLTVPTKRTTRNPEVVLHTASEPIERGAWTLRAGIPVTRPEVTVGMLATGGTDLGHLAAITRDAALDHHVGTATLAAYLAPHASSHGHTSGDALLDYLLELAGTPEIALDVSVRSAANHLARTIINNPAVTEELRRTIAKVKLPPMRPPAIATARSLPGTDALREPAKNVVHHLLERNSPVDPRSLSNAYLIALAESPYHDSLDRLRDHLAHHTLDQVVEDARRSAQLDSE